MTDETRILRTVGIPVVIAVLLLVMVPKMCGRMVTVAKARQEKAARESGLRIQSSQKAVAYPTGLDADRVRYLVEIDSRFSTPYMAKIFKTASVSGLAEAQIVPVLQKLGYAEYGADGALTLTRDGILHVEGLVDDGTTWTFPLAKRQFDAVKSIAGDSTNANAIVVWRWQTNAIGAALLAKPARHEATAQLANVGGHWSLTGINDLEQDLN
jgi:hypothetical protein